MSLAAESAKSPEEKIEEPRKAIHYLLNRIRTTPELAWHFIGTESYALLAEAYAAMTGMKRDEIEAAFRPKESFCCRACREKEAAERRAA